MFKICNILAGWRGAIVSMPECTVFQVEIVFSYRMLKEISASNMF